MEFKFALLLFQVSIFVSRDLDSRFGDRESAAVSEWLSSSNSSFHVMRDHPEHAVPMLGGAWGVRMDLRQGLDHSIYG